MDVRQVDQLPELNQNDFPALPEIPEGTTLVPFNSKWANAEKEFAAGIIVTHCIRAHIWKAMDAPAFGDALRRHPMAAMVRQDVVNALWKMIADKQADIVKVGDTQYVIPTPELASIALAESNSLRVV